MLSIPQATVPLSLGSAALPQDCPPCFGPQEKVPTLNSFVKYWNVHADEQNISGASCVSLTCLRQVFHKEQSFLKESHVPYISLITVSWFSGQRSLQCTRQDVLWPAWSSEAALQLAAVQLAGGSASASLLGDPIFNQLQSLRKENINRSLSTYTILKLYFLKVVSFPS